MRMPISQNGYIKFNKKEWKSLSDCIKQLQNVALSQPDRDKLNRLVLYVANAKVKPNAVSELDQLCKFYEVPMFKRSVYGKDPTAGKHWKKPSEEIREFVKELLKEELDELEARIISRVRAELQAEMRAVNTKIAQLEKRITGTAEQEPQEQAQAQTDNVVLLSKPDRQQKKPLESKTNVVPLNQAKPLSQSQMEEIEEKYNDLARSIGPHLVKLSETNRHVSVEKFLDLVSRDIKIKIARSQLVKWQRQIDGIDEENMDYTNPDSIFESINNAIMSEAKAEHEDRLSLAS